MNSSILAVIIACLFLGVALFVFTLAENYRDRKWINKKETPVSDAAPRESIVDVARRASLRVKDSKRRARQRRAANRLK